MQAAIPFMRVLPACPNQPPKALLPNIIDYSGDRIPTYGSGGHKDSWHSGSAVRAASIHAVFCAQNVGYVCVCESPTLLKTAWPPHFPSYLGEGCWEIAKALWVSRKGAHLSPQRNDIRFWSWKPWPTLRFSGYDNCFSLQTASREKRFSLGLGCKHLFHRYLGLRESCSA